MNYEDILALAPYSLNKREKSTLLTARLKKLTKHHIKNCSEYKAMMDSIDFDPDTLENYRDLPYLPVRLFKELSLMSVAQEEVVKTMTSSGTSGQRVSKIYLDRNTSSNQQKTMVKIVSDFTGSSRMPMIILDCPSVIKNRNMFSARGAGILGFSIFGTKKIYALNDDMQLNVEALRTFLEEYKDRKILLFGFTFMVWQYFYKELVRLKDQGITFDLSNGILIHGGGWKKLIGEAVSADVFHDSLRDVCGLNSIHDYYGMVEQTGCIYMQCECGHLHASIFSDVIVRNPLNFNECAIGEKGILQVVSMIPESYPGHSLLTEDEGMILGEDDCPCGRKGKYFKIIGRIKNAEIRGCSDTFAADHSDVKEDILAENTTLKKINYLVGSQKMLEQMPFVAPKQPFDEEVIAFLNDLSRELMKSTAAKTFPDVVTLGFWLRKGSVSSLKNRFKQTDNQKHIGRGVAFHIAPSNVPVNYAYSLVTGLLCGNANVVRVPSKDFPQIAIINNAINETIKLHPDIKKYIVLVRYDRDKDINDTLSNMCDVRVIWGGDNTIRKIRKSELPTRATEITFADRYSLAVINTDYYMSITKNGTDKSAISHIASDFYNDTYLSDQNACTSPRLIAWIGKNKDSVKKIFWDSLYALIKEKYPFQQIQGVDKLTQEYLVAAALNEVKTKRTDFHDNLLVRINVNKPDQQLMNYRGNSGYFYEYDCDDIIELRDFCNDTHCQTIGILGETEMLRPLLDSAIKGVDRIVPIGHTMDFDLIWDGYNLVEEMTRKVAVWKTNL